MVDMLLFRAFQWWICSCVELVNGGYAHVQWWSMLDMAYAVVVNVGYAHVQWWSMVDMLMCRSGQWWICSCAVMVNGGYTHVQWWICSCLELVNGGYAHV